MSAPIMGLFVFVVLSSYVLFHFKPYYDAIAVDDDVKLAPGPGAPISGSKSRWREESEEAATQAYLRQRMLGNTKIAGELGSRIAREITITQYPEAPAGIDSGVFIVQAKVLCAFAVNRALEEHAPNSIVKQSALAAFYDYMQSDDTEFYEAIEKSGSFSLYMYLFRSESAEPMAFATAFAEACGDRKCEQCFEAGLAAYTTAYNHAASLIESAGFR